LSVVEKSPATLAETVAVARQFSHVTSFQIDLTSEENVQPLVRHLGDVGRLDILIHCAGIIRQDLVEQARIADFDLQYATNVRAPYLLTQRLLPLLTVASGQIVFINLHFSQVIQEGRIMVPARTTARRFGQPGSSIASCGLLDALTLGRLRCL
jgi:NAD(P)-dependent dehydrogenase (short-subunit alcohol dehydrogenase family)